MNCPVCGNLLEGNKCPVCGFETDEVRTETTSNNQPMSEDLYQTFSSNQEEQSQLMDETAEENTYQQMQNINENQPLMDETQEDLSEQNDTSIDSIYQPVQSENTIESIYQPVQSENTIESMYQPVQNNSEEITFDSIPTQTNPENADQTNVDQTIDNSQNSSDEIPISSLTMDPLPTDNQGILNLRPLPGRNNDALNPQPLDSTIDNNEDEKPQQLNNPKDKNNKVVIIAAVILVIIALLIVYVAFFMKKPSNNKNEETTTTTTTTTTVAVEQPTNTDKEIKIVDTYYNIPTGYNVISANYNTSFILKSTNKKMTFNLVENGENQSSYSLYKSDLSILKKELETIYGANYKVDSPQITNVSGIEVIYTIITDGTEKGIYFICDTPYKAFFTGLLVNSNKMEDLTILDDFIGMFFNTSDKIDTKQTETKYASPGLLFYILNF